MFGGQQNTTPFGSPPASTPFGAPQQQQTPTFGTPAPAFGSSTTTGFGTSTTTPAFGQQQQQPQAGGFGGAFGTAAQAPAPTTTFGGGFGSSTTTASPFGAPAPSTGLFGGGATASAPGGGIFSGGTSAFGSTGTTQQTSGFGTTSTSTGFGQSSTGFGASTTPAPFGAPTPSTGTSPFGGAQAPAPSAFGAPAPSTSLFGGSSPAATGQSIFGGGSAAAPQQPGGMFGQPAATAQGAVSGTNAVPFTATTKSDGTTSGTITLQSITAMPAYEGASFEEWRFRDYSQGNRGSGSQQQQASGGFGSAFGQTAGPSPAAGTTFGGSAFGTTPATAPAGGLFGAPAAPAPAFAGFGGTAAPAPTGGLFGATPASTPATGFGFGAKAAPAPATGSLFGAQAPAPTGGFFSAPAAVSPSPSIFGSSPAPAGTSLFGTTPGPAPATGFGVGTSPAPAPGPLFGGAPAPASTGSLFGATAPAPSTSLFGGAPAPAGTSLFGTTTTPAPSSGFGFGAPPPAPTPAFGAPAGGSLFGAPAPATGGLFSGSAQQGSSIFGTPSAAQAPAGQQFATQPAMIVPPSADAVLQQQLAAIENQRKELEQMEVWRGGSPQTSSTIPSSKPESQGLRVSPYSPPIGSAVPYRSSPRSTTRIRPRGFDTTPKLESSQHTPLPFMSPDGFVASSTKRLVIKSDAPKPSMRLRLRDVAAEETKEEAKDDVILRLPAVSPPAQAHVASPSASDTGVASPPAAAASATSPDSTSGRDSTPTNGHGYDFYNKVIASATSTPGSTKKSPEVRESAKASLVPKLTMPGYAVSPTLEEMNAMSEADLAAVSGFTVSRDGFGSVSWDGSVDVRDVDLDAIISIKNRDVSVYESADENGTKPPEGTKLNRSAVITMYGVRPKEGSDAAAIEKFERKIEKTTKSLNAELISYNSGNGVWKFRVPHFSRYALLDDSDDDSDTEARQKVEVAQNFESGEGGGLSPADEKAESKETSLMDVDQSWLSASVTEDGEMLDEANDVEDDVRERAENALAKLEMERVEARKQKSILKKRMQMEKQQEEASALFPDEGVAIRDSSACDSIPIPPTGEEIAISSRPGICSRIAQRSGIQSFTETSTDYGVRMGRSFRVGWKPDGSFMHLQTGSGVVIQRSRPVFTDGTMGEAENAKLLETHLKHANKVSSPLLECPTFCLAPADDGKRRDSLSDYVSNTQAQGKKKSDPEEGLVLMRAFSLLLCLFANEDSHVGNAVAAPMIEAADKNKVRVASSEQSQIHSCVDWLRAACAEDKRNDVQDALEKSDVYSAVFAAISGGDIEQACDIAMRYGNRRLAQDLADSVAGFDGISNQIQQWAETEAAKSIPAELLCIYSLLGQDLTSIGQVHLACVAEGKPTRLDWRRRLCMLLMFGAHPSDGATLPSLLERYRTELAQETVPYPSPRYIWNEHVVEGSGPQSLLYKILGLTNAVGRDVAEKESLSDIVAPSGYTATTSDFSGSFHIAAAISALDVSASLSPAEQATLLDSYASQLVSCGQWDLAVYVMLTAFRMDRPEDLRSRQRIAKAIVVQNCPDIPQGDRIPKRAELESIGVPREWFEEALAYRCGDRGDALNYIKHLCEFSPEEARRAIEELVVPNMLFMAPNEMQNSLTFLKAFAWDEDTLARTMVDFFQLAEDIMALSQSEDDEGKSEELPLLVELADSIKTRLLTHRLYIGGIEDPSTSFRFIPSYRVVPTAQFLAEALAGVSLLQLQLGAMCAGSSIWDDGYLRETPARPLKVASELAYIAARKNGDASVDEDVALAGLI